MEVDTFAFIWSIKKFSAFKNHNVIRSPRFRGGPQTNYIWRVLVNPAIMLCDDAVRKLEDNHDDDLESYDNDSDSSDDELILSGDENLGDDNDRNNDADCYLGVCFYLSPFLNSDKFAQVKKLKINCRITFLDQEHKPITYFEYNDEKYLKGEDWDFTFQIKTMEFRKPSYHVVVDDEIKIHCQVWIEYEPMVKSFVGTPAEMYMEDKKNINSLKKLGKDLKTELDLATFADVSLVTKTKTFKAHKFMLNARSPVFQAMLKSTSKEAVQSSVEIPDFKENVVKAMLDYIYSGETPVLLFVKTASDLLGIAHKYELTGLKEHCENFLGNHLNITTAAEILMLAHKLQALKLKTTAMDYINKKKDKIQDVDGFKVLELADSSLLMELYFSQE